MKHLLYPFLVLLAGMCYGILSTFVKGAYDVGFTVADVAFSQYGTALLFLIPAALLSKGPFPKGKHFLFYLLIGIPMCMTSIFYYASLTTLSASLAVVFLFQSIWIGFVIEAIWKRKTPSKVKLLAMVFALTGTTFAAGLWEEGASFSLSWGMVWGVLAALSYATFLSLNAVQDPSPVFKRSLLMTGSAAVLTFFVLKPTAIYSIDTTVSLLPYGLALAFFSAIFPLFLLAKGMPHVGPALGNLLSASELPMALFMAYMVLGERISFTEWIGIFLIVIGIVLGNKK